MRCKKALKQGGVICIKDNAFVTSKRKDGVTDHFFVDREDSAITRSPDYYSAIFKISGLEILHYQKQSNFPDELYPNMMWAVA